MYKIISGKTLPTEFKIKVNPEQSATLQQHLFSIGYAFGGEKTVKFTNHKHLYIWDDGSICINTPFDDEEHFKNYPYSQIHFEDYFEPISVSTTTPSKLRELLEGMTQEEFDKSWEEIKNLKLIGPTIEEYLKSK